MTNPSDHNSSKGEDDDLHGAIDESSPGSDQVGGFFIESLISARDALELLKLHLEDAGDGGAAVRRVAHSLRASAATFGFPQIVNAAAAVQQASRPDLAERLTTLIEKLDEVVEQEPSHNVRILIVESDPDLADLLWFTLSTPNRTLMIARSAAEAEAILERESVSLIVLDLDLQTPAHDLTVGGDGASAVQTPAGADPVLIPSGDGAPFAGAHPAMDAGPAGQEVLLRLRSRTRTAFIPTLVLANEDSAALKMECLALGADAFYAKPFDPAELSSMVAVRLQRRAFIDSKDALTGLPDRIAFEETFERIRTVYGSSDQPLSLAVVDFDDFEQINNIYGHAVGDRVLRRSADLISRSLRASDVLARWEGQEFTLLFPNATAAEADEVLYRAQQSVRHERFGMGSGRSFRASFSAGICEVKSDESLRGALGRARTFVAKAKAFGPGRILRAGKQIDRAGETILVVEDDKLIARLVRQRLEREGYNVIHSNNGAQAWELAQRQPASLVLLDVRLPGMNGFELLGRLRTLPSYGRCPIIMLTAMGSEVDIQRGFALGADDYLLKPFSPVELMARIHRRLESAARVSKDDPNLAVATATADDSAQGAG